PFLQLCAQDSSRYFTWDVYGWDFLYYLIQIHADLYGRILIQPFYGMYLRYLLTFRFHCSFGIRVYCRILLQFVTGQRQNSAKCFMALLLLDGQEARNT